MSKDTTYPAVPGTYWILWIFERAIVLLAVENSLGILGPSYPVESGYGAPHVRS
jgi:hypothetical protein